MRKTVLLVLLLLPAMPAHAFVCLKTDNGTCLHWAQGQATLLSFLGNPGALLINGTTTWDQNSINAANDWNAVGAAFRFNVNVGGQLNEPCGPRGGSHACPNTGPARDNPVLFRADFCGRAFGDIVELTNNCWDPGSGAMINAPVFVSSNVPWNAYDGPILFSGGNAINDIRRVLLHEFGHVLGLDHPDQNGQTVQAIMNSHESNLDRLQPDDIAGLQSIYPGGEGPAATTNSCQIAPGGTSSGWLLALPAVLVLLRRRL